MKNKVIISLIAILIIIAIVIGIVSLNNKKDNNNNSSNSSNTGTSVKNNLSGNSKMLVVYFSLPETSNPNSMTTEEENSAIVVDGEVLGNVQYMAKLISDNTGADIYRIEPKIPYTVNHSDLVNIAKKEQNENARPEIKDTIDNFNDYDTIFIGYPIW